jgi:hypothetical protein
LFLIVNFNKGCHCKTCIDNLTVANNKIPYKNKDIVLFNNDTLGISNDTISITLDELSKSRYGCLAPSDHDNETTCSDLSTVLYSNHFELQIEQGPNSFNNRIKYTIVGFETEVDTIQFNYKNNLFKAIHSYFKVDSFGSTIWNSYKKYNFDPTYIVNDYYYTVEKA